MTGVAGLRRCFDATRGGDATPASAETIEQEQSLDAMPVYVDERAMQVATQLGLNHPAVYMRNIDALKESRDAIEQRGLLGPDVDLLPLYPPAVMNYSELIKRAARAEGINPNFLAATLTVESAGIEDVVSPDWGFGLG